MLYARGKNTGYSTVQKKLSFRGKYGGTSSADDSRRAIDLYRRHNLSYRFRTGISQIDKYHSLTWALAIVTNKILASRLLWGGDDRPYTIQNY